MENLEITINLPNLKLNIPEKEINFHTLERIVFDLSRKIGQELLEELLQIIDDKLKKERKRGILSNHGKRLRHMTTLLEISPSTKGYIRTEVVNTFIS